MALSGTLATSCGLMDTSPATLPLPLCSDDLTSYITEDTGAQVGGALTSPPLNLYTCH